MNDDFNMLRPNGDDDQSDNGLDWLSSLDSNDADTGADDLPPAQPDDPLSWLQEYAEPEAESEVEQPASSADLDWLQSDELFESLSDESENPDWSKSAGIFDTANTDETPEPVADVPPWLKENAPDPIAALSDADLFSGLDEALGLGGSPATKEPVTNNTPSWLDQEPGELDVFAADDLFADFNAPPSQPAADEDEDALPDEDDIMGQLKLTDTGSANWFVDADEQPAADEVPDWLQSLDDVPEPEPEAELPVVPVEAEAVPADDDFLADLFSDVEADEDDPFAEKQPAAFSGPGSFDAPGLQDIDSLLASYDSASSLPQGDTSNLSDADFDRLLSDAEVEQISSRRPGDERREALPNLSPDAPDWLAELGASVGSVDEMSAAAMVRKQTQNERSLDDLSDRLFALHEAGQALPAPSDAGSAEVIKNLLPGVNQLIPAAPIKTGLPGIAGDVALTGQQRDKINLLKTLVAVEEEKPRGQQVSSAIDRTLDSPNLSDLLDSDTEAVEQPQAVEVAPVVVPRRRGRIKMDRLVIALLLTVAVVLPFIVAPLRIGDLPPAQFVAGSSQQAAYDRVNSIISGQLALVAAEYGPTGAAELDSALDAVLRHILLRGARPVIVSGHAVGLLHAQNILDNILHDGAFLARIQRTSRPLVANTDYYVSHYLAGEAIGLRDFGQNLVGALNTDVNGLPMNLRVSSLHEFSVIVIVAERGEDVRAWGEQVAPLAGQPLVIMTGYSAAPLAEPYALAAAPGAVSGIGGMIVGYRDAYTYRQMVDGNGTTTSVPVTNTPAAPTETGAEATEGAAPPPEITAEASPEAVAETAVPGTEATVQSVENAATAVEATAAPTSEVTIEATVQPTSPGVLVQAVVKSGPVNVRDGPSTTFTPIAALQTGEVVQVIGRNGAATWIQIRTQDGVEGWVSAQLIDIQEPTPEATIEPTPTREGAFQPDPNAVVGLISDSYFFVPAFQEPEATPEVTLEPTVEPTLVPPTAVPTIAVSASTSTPTYRDERWYGMTLGLMMIIVIIALAALVNIVRGLFRRGN